MASYFYTSFVPSLLCALIVVQVLKFCHSRALTNVTCTNAEREALLKFKQILTDPSRRLGSWTGEGCCKWQGVECSEETGHITKLDLHNPCDDLDLDMCLLGGMIHPALNELKYLKYLDLSFNNFSTEKIRDSFTALQELEYLNLSFAGYGLISNQLSNLSNLRYLDLSGWRWDPSSVIENLGWLSTLSNLKYLDLSYVPLLNPKGWLSPINMLSSLESLIWRGCDLDDASASLPVNFTSLRFLDLSQNSMNSSIPPWLQNFSKLEHLDLSDNELQGLFPSVVLGNNRWLRFLDVSSNRMEGELLKNFSLYCNLKELNVFSNNFSGGISNTKDGASNCERSSLKIIDASNNSFSGHLPNNPFEKLKDLEFLDFSRNSISGPIPATMGQLSSLRMLYLSFNKLSGNIPENIGLIPNLEVMDVGNNQLDGIVSEFHFANLTGLTVLKLYSNKLVINVSTSWVPPFQIQEILMSSCKVGPEFPNWLRLQRSILALDLSNASISDEVPNWLPDVLSNVERLDLSNNMLRGNISRIIGKKMPQLTQVSLSGNNLSGEIPNSLCMSNGLSFLDLSKNQLSGGLPGCWRKSQALLEWILLADNKLTDQIPDSLCHLEKLRVLGLNENALSGPLPKCLLKLDMVILDLSGNQFTGGIPPFGNPKSFEIIDLERNYFTGDIPLQLCHLVNLQYLSLNRNNFSGGIPHCFNNFSRMWANSTLYFRSVRKFSLKVDMRGRSIEFTSTLPYLFSIDLSGNALDGQIPEGLTMLARLKNLNLSQNKLVGKIPADIGNLRDLESLDLSNNRLSGEIPPSISNLDFLSRLDLSRNNLSGRIPSGNHLSTLENESTFRGNGGLCGAPFLKDCPGDEHNDMGKQDDHSSSGNESNRGDCIIVWFYTGLGPGFAVALTGFCCILHFKRSWRISYIRAVDRIVEKLLMARRIRMLGFKRASHHKHKFINWHLA